MTYFLLLENLAIRLFLTEREQKYLKSRRKADRYFSLEAYDEACENYRSDWELFRAFFEPRLNAQWIYLSSDQLSSLNRNLLMPESCKALTKLRLKAGKLQLLN